MEIIWLKLWETRFTKYLLDHMWTFSWVKRSLDVFLLKSIGIDLMAKCNEEAESDPLNIHSQIQYKPGFSQPWHYWYFGPDNSLLWVAVLYITGCISGIFGFYPLDASWIPPFSTAYPAVTTKSEGKNCSWLRTTAVNKWGNVV